ncbi:MAG: hypothetical protein H7Z43_10750, partial [Clostridia bacterium]|nr:hypothetical protein [Deltaproteobacteria bacterium]
MTPPTSSDNTAKPRGKRSWVRRLLLAVVAFPFLVAFGFFIVRLVFSDERLRGLIENQGTKMLGAPVHIGKLTLSLLHEITIEGLVIGPPEGFTKDVLRVDYAHLAWVVPKPTNIEVVLPDISAHGISVVYEQRAAGTNVEAIQKNLRPGQSPQPEQEKSAESAKTIDQPDLPVRVAVTHFEISDTRAEALTPEMHCSIDKMAIAGSFDGYRKSIALDLWIGLGDRQGEGRSTAAFVKPGVDVASTQRGGVGVRSSGFGDVAVTMDFAATTNVQAPYALPELETRANAKINVNFIEQKVSLEEAFLGLG